MSVLDEQTVSAEAAKRRRARRAQVSQELEALDDRRRVNRGLGFTNVSRAEDHWRASRGLGAVEVVGRVLWAGLILLFIPVQFVLALTRPREVARRFREAPSRLKSNARRWQMAARQGDTVAGFLSQVRTTTSTFVAHELQDMEGGFPSAEELLTRCIEWVREQGRTWRTQIRPGPVLVHQATGAAATGVFAFAVLFGLFVCTHNGLERLAAGDRLPLARIVVSGTQDVPEAEVKRLLGVRVGQNLLAMNPADLRQRLAANPWLRVVAVDRDLGEGVLSIEVEERRADLLLAGRPVRLLDERGEAFKTLAVGDPVDLPVLAGVPDTAPPELIATVASAARDVLAALDGSGPVERRDVAEVRWDEDDGFALLLRDGVPVRLGKSDFGPRLARLQRALVGGKLPLQAVAAVDLSLWDRMVVVPKIADAGGALRSRLEGQALTAAQRARLLELDRQRRGLSPPGVP